MYAEDTRANPCMLTMRMPSTAKPRSTSMETMRSDLATGAAAGWEGDEFNGGFGVGGDQWTKRN